MAPSEDEAQQRFLSHTPDQPLLVLSNVHPTQEKEPIWASLPRVQILRIPVCFTDLHDALQRAQQDFKRTS